MRADGVRVGALLPPPPAYRSTEKMLQLLAAAGQTPAVAAAPICAKLHWLMRDKLRRLADRAGVGFVDTWAVLAEDDMFLRAEFELDGAHVTRGAAEAVLPTLCAALGVA